ncbi:MAG TPA: hypothetical protein VGQ30_10595 [Gemmatimonadaceae bacterium]|jgi:hypothetical protein|nr:hypothetical protein [Gemmatimonadaceae bacterium]
MPEVTLEFKKKSDGAAILTFVRADGSRTSSPIGDARGFGPVHDLAHYVVESVLGITHGFIGLCAEGWTIQDFEKDAKANIPPEAGVAEVVAGEVSRMEIVSQWLTVDDFNWTVAASGFKMSEPDFDAIHRALVRLRADWNALAPGATMPLRFVPGRKVTVDDEGMIA